MRRLSLWMFARGAPEKSAVKSRWERTTSMAY
jgi:hypothetical protein